MPSKSTNSHAPPAPWAVHSGQDAFGAFADLEVKSQVQRFRWCPPGRFVMGSPEDLDQHNVTLTRGFWMADTPVTQGLYAALMVRNPSQFRSAFSVDLPVERVSWNDAQELIKTINKLTRSDSFRLPTEAEWEYAARAGATGNRHGPVHEIAWAVENSRMRPHSVGQRRPNPWGLCDTLGNVWEWVEDVYGAYPPGDLIDPKGLDRDLARDFGRVVRGGSWFDGPRSIRAAARFRATPSLREEYIGFRLVRTGP
jgi:formylglycine-generating enzyme required for sulfatase activity